MSDTPGTSVPGRVVRALWLLLATLDACLLIYLTLSYRWFDWEMPQIATPAAFIVLWIVYGVIAFLTALTMAVVAAIGAGIVRQFLPARRPARWLTALAVMPLVIALLFAVFEWIRHLLPIAAFVRAARLDRLEVFDQLVEPAENSSWRLAELMSDDRMSIGLYLGVLVAVAYLVEKYLLAWFRVRWPVPLVALAMVASLVWITSVGERVQREFVAARTWRPLTEAQTFPQALQACEALGTGWTLPRPAELRGYLATRPDAIRSWKGVVWTNTAAERGHTRGVVVEVAPRRTGVWRVGQMGGRSPSACETDTRDRGPIDAFTQQKARLCEATLDSPYLHPGGMVTVVDRRGTVPEFGQAGTVCVQQPAVRDVDPNRGTGVQLYTDVQPFSTEAEYLAAVRTYCGALTWPKDFICLTIGAEPLPFEENGSEWLYRLACDNQGRVEGCTGYATLMDLRGDTERARQYRERASLVASRRR